MREEMARLTRKLRTAEAELDTKRSQAQRQAANTEKLQEQLQEITAGADDEHFCDRVLYLYCVLLLSHCTG